MKWILLPVDMEVLECHGDLYDDIKKEHLRYYALCDNETQEI